MLSFRLEKQTSKNVADTTFKDEIVKDRINRDIRTLFEQGDDCYKAVRVGNFWNNNYVKYQSYGDRNKSLSLEECLDKIRTYLRDIIIDLQESDTWKIQLTIIISFISPKDVDEERVMHSKSDNIFIN